MILIYDKDNQNDIHTIRAIITKNIHDDNHYENMLAGMTSASIMIVTITIITILLELV